MLRGLIIDAELEYAEKLKHLIEDNEQLDVKMDFYNGEEGMQIINTGKYDFVITSVIEMPEEIIEDHIVALIDLCGEKKTDYLSLRMARDLIYIDRTNILGLEVVGKISFVHTENGSYRVGRIAMGKLIELLNIPSLIRCHKSYAVNVKYIRTLHKETRTRWKAIFFVKTDFDCRISSSYINEVCNKLEKINKIRIGQIAV